MSHDESAAKNNSSGATGLQEDDSGHLRVMIFKLGDEQYGTPLLEVREVIKFLAIKSVPFMADYFKGVINLRGQIVSVIDLRKKFLMPIYVNERGLILVIERPEGLVGCIVDDLISVEMFSLSEIASKSYIESRIPKEFFIGIAKRGDALVSLINLAGCLTVDDMRLVSRTQKELVA